MKNKVKKETSKKKERYKIKNWQAYKESLNPKISIGHKKSLQSV
jgi:hypothetical protein